MLSILNYTISFIVILIIFVYLIELPLNITNNKKLVNYYYYENWYKYIPLDWLLVLIYILIGLYVSNKFIDYMNIKSECNKIIIKSLFIILITILISGLFLLYITYYPIKNLFMSEWFNTVGYKGVIYDVILILLIYLFYEKLIKN